MIILKMTTVPLLTSATVEAGSQLFMMRVPALITWSRGVWGYSGGCRDSPHSWPILGLVLSATVCTVFTGHDCHLPVISCRLNHHLHLSESKSLPSHRLTTLPQLLIYSACLDTHSTHWDRTRYIHQLTFWGPTQHMVETVDNILLILIFTFMIHVSFIISISLLLFNIHLSVYLFSLCL